MDEAYGTIKSQEFVHGRKLKHAPPAILRPCLFKGLMIGAVPLEQRTKCDLQRIGKKKFVCELCSTFSVAITHQISSLRVAGLHNKHFAEESILHERQIYSIITESLL